MVIEQTLTSDEVPFFILSIGALLAVSSHSDDGFLHLITRHEQPAFRGQHQSVGYALGRVIDDDGAGPDKKPALAVIHHDLLQQVLDLSVAYQAPVVDLIYGQGELAYLQPEDVQQVGDNPLPVLPFA